MSIYINPGVTINPGVQISVPINIPVSNGLVVNLDAGNSASYPGYGTDWTDLVSSSVYTLINNPTYSSSFGGYFDFNPSSIQYAQGPSLPSTLLNWSIDVWHYYNGTNSGGSPCIVTEKFTSNINFTLGNTNDSSTNLQAGFFNGQWNTTPLGYTLTPGYWYNIAGTYDGSIIKLYINGVVVESQVSSSTPVSSGTGIYLMKRWDNYENDCWGGKLSVVNIYNRALNNAEILQNFNYYRTRYGI